MHLCMFVSFILMILMVCQTINKARHHIDYYNHALLPYRLVSVL